METNFVKKHFKHILLVTVYTILFMVIYVIWFESLWHLWFVDVIAALLILSGGIVIGYFYLKGIAKEENKDNNQSESKPLEDNKDTNVVEDNKEEVVEEKSDGE